MERDLLSRAAAFFAHENVPSFPVRFMARHFGVSASGFYEWAHRQTHPAARP